MAFTDYIPGGNMINSFLHPEKGYQEAGKESEKYYRDAQGKLQPIIDQGQSQFGRLNNQADRLNNPAQLENEWASSYKESPYSQHLINQATSEGKNAASSMGLLGSSAALHNIQQSAGDISQSHRQQYMNDLMQKYMASIGLGQNIYSAGANASSTSSENAMNEGNTQAQAKFGAINAPGEMFGKLAGAGINAGINYATGGTAGAAKAA